MNTDLTTTLGPDTLAWLQALVRSDLSPSHYRVLLVLREIQCSPNVIAQLTGLKGPRVRSRLRDLQGKGLARVVEVLSDRTQIWGLPEDIAKDGVESFPTEAVIQERRARSQYGAPVLDPQVTKTWKGNKPLGPQSIVDKLNVDLLKMYEAKNETDT